MTSATASAPPEQKILWRLRWRTVPGHEARAEIGLLAACAELYSTSYGVWGPRGPRPGEKIRREPADVAALLASDDSFLAVAELPEGEVVGYCIAVFAEAPDHAGGIAWVSQLVVGEAYRNEGIATSLLYSIWQFSDRYAWGMVTASPYAVRALESATRRACRIKEIRRRGDQVISALRTDVPYLPAGLQSDGSHRRAVVDTRFFVSHEDIDEKRRLAARGERPWGLGGISEGEEWFACTFSSQTPVPLPPERLEAILAGADRIWMDAFARMTLDGAHLWHTHTANDVDGILSRIPLASGSRILDVGCGDGRHSFALAERGFIVEGVDVVPALIEQAQEESAGDHNLSFTLSDARELISGEPVDLALLLYDVLGSSANSEDDLRLLRNVFARLVPGGRLALSVMSSGPTRGRIPAAQRPHSNVEFVEALESLPPSNTMEKSGDIFDPKLLLVYRGVYYRKEQFLQVADYLPSEHIVRDLRYSSNTLKELLECAGFELEHLRPVQSGHWNREPPLEETDSGAKELFAVARRPL